MPPILLAVPDYQQPSRPRIIKSLIFTTTSNDKTSKHIALLTNNGLVLFFQDNAIHWVTALKHSGPLTSKLCSLHILPSAYFLTCCTSRILLCIEHRTSNLNPTITLLSLDDGRCLTAFSSPVKLPSTDRLPLHSGICLSAPPRTALEWELSSRLLIFKSLQSFFIWDYLELKTVFKLHYKADEPSSSSSELLSAAGEVAQEEDVLSKYMVGHAIDGVSLCSGRYLAVYTSEGQLHLWDLTAVITKHWKQSKLLGQPRWASSDSFPISTRIGLADVWHHQTGTRLHGRLYPGPRPSELILQVDHKILLFQVTTDNQLQIVQTWQIPDDRSTAIVSIHCTADYDRIDDELSLKHQMTQYRLWPIHAISISHSLVIATIQYTYSLDIATGLVTTMEHFPMTKAHLLCLFKVELTEGRLQAGLIHQTKHRLVQSTCPEDKATMISTDDMWKNFNERTHAACLVRLTDNQLKCYFSDVESGFALRVLRPLSQAEELAETSTLAKTVVPELFPADSPSLTSDLPEVSDALQTEEEESKYTGLTSGLAPGLTPLPLPRSARRSMLRSTLGEFFVRQDGISSKPTNTDDMAVHNNGESYVAGQSIFHSKTSPQKGDDRTVLWRESGWVCEQFRLPVPLYNVYVISLLGLNPLTPADVDHDHGTSHTLIVAGTTSGHVMVYRNRELLDCKCVTALFSRTHHHHEEIDGYTLPCAIVRLLNVSIITGDRIEESQNLCVVETSFSDEILIAVAPNTGQISVITVVPYKLGGIPDSIVYDPWQAKLYRSCLDGSTDVIGARTGDVLFHLSAQLTQQTLNRWHMQLQTWKTNASTSTGGEIGTSPVNPVPHGIASSLGLDVSWVRILRYQSEQRSKPLNRLLRSTGYGIVEVPSLEYYVKKETKFALSKHTMETIALSLSCWFPWDGSNKDSVKIVCPKRRKPSALGPRPLTVTTPDDGGIHSCHVPKAYKAAPLFFVLQSPIHDICSLEFLRTNSVLDDGCRVSQTADEEVTSALSQEVTSDAPLEGEYKRPDPASLWMLFKQIISTDVIWAWQTHVAIDSEKITAEIRKCRQYLYRCLLHYNRRYGGLTGPIAAPCLGLLSLSSHLLVSARSVAARTSASEILKQTSLRAARGFQPESHLNMDLRMLLSCACNVLEGALGHGEPDVATITHGRQLSGEIRPPSTSLGLVSNKSAPDLKSLNQNIAEIRPLSSSHITPLLLHTSSFFNSHATLCESALYSLLIMNYYTLNDKCNSNHYDSIMSTPRRLLAEAVVRVLSNPLAFFKWVPLWSTTDSTCPQTSPIKKALSDPYVKFKVELLLDTIESHGRTWRNLWFGDDMSQAKKMYEIITNAEFEPPPTDLISQARALERTMVKTLEANGNMKLLHTRVDLSALSGEASSDRDETSARLPFLIYLLCLPYVVEESFAPVITSLLFQLAHMQPFKVIALTSGLIDQGDTKIDLIKVCVRCLGKIALKDGNVYYVINQYIFEQIITKAVDPAFPKPRSKLQKLIALFLWELSRVLPYVAFDKINHKVATGCIDGTVLIVSLYAANACKAVKNSSSRPPH